ncbi:MAG TPA: 2-oxo-4-hydroxy-4-carboxy-5-ureidoimidazoline decarboxylase [Chloroflexota bacterium]|nr:2-oxo-4-hydroxy-4-carboxy-5-ureidoimidazoline decarboxylase [Chloroflexota bacterium]
MVSLAELNRMGREAFVAAVGSAWERSPWVAAAAWERRPFRDLGELHRAMVAALRAAPHERRLALIRAHPDLAAPRPTRKRVPVRRTGTRHRAAVAAELTAESTREQASAGLDRLTAGELERFQGLNGAYKARFGFPFVVCVREHTRASILAAFEERLGQTAEQEVETALGEIAKIARLRLEEKIGS